MRSFARGALCALVVACALPAAGCGAKSQLRVWDAAPVPPECFTDNDCDDMLYCDGVETCREGRCVPGAPVVCTDGDECTIDQCVEASRSCTHTPATPDADGDGYRAPLPGHQPGDPGSCGNDCNDHNAAIHPGATEICNGLDDNCNGLIDEGAMYTSLGPDVAVSDPETAPSSPGGLAWFQDHYMACYSGYMDGTSHVYFSALDRLGNRTSTPPQRLETMTPSDSYGAPVAWSGNVLGIVWEDRRDGDYEIYFNRLTPSGDKLGPDERVTFATGFSINPQIVWTGSEFVLVWEDERDSVGTGSFQIYAQRIDEMGRQIEDNIRLTNPPADAESPVVAVGPNVLGVAWLDSRGGMPGDPDRPQAIFFNTYSLMLQRLGLDQRITDMGFLAASPTIAWNVDRFMIAWHDADRTDPPPHGVWGTTRNAGGGLITAPHLLTMGPQYSRYPQLQPLGDRAFLVWADDRDGDGYEIYARTLTPDLQPMGAETRVTMAPRDSVYPSLSLGPEGDLGILFMDQRDGPWRVRFTRLQCAIPH